MSDFNSLILTGRITRDPELKYLPNQTAVCEFGIACGEKRGDREDTMFMDVTMFGKQAEAFNQYQAKGNLVLVSGRVKYETWEKDGQKRSKHKMIAESFTFLPNKRDGEQEAPPQRQAPRQPPRQPQRQAAPQAPYGEEQQFNEDDIPFASARR